MTAWLHIAVTVIATSAASPGAAGLSPPSSLDYDAIRAMPVQYDGRWMPLDTVARDVVRTVTGTMRYEDDDAVGWLLAWTFDPDAYMNQRLISIGPEALRKELKLPRGQTAFSYNELVRHEPLQALIDEFGRRQEARRPDPLESKVRDINDKLGLLHRVFTGQVIRPVPDAKDSNGAWQPIGADASDNTEAMAAVRQAWDALARAFRSDDGGAFTAASERLVTALAALPAAHRPTPARLATELRYNRMRPFRLAWKLMAFGVGLAGIALLGRRRVLDVVAVIALIIAFGVLTAGLVMRWQIAGRIPAANMFESLLFLGWGAGAFAIVSMLLMRDRFVPLTASAIGAIAVGLADELPLDPFVRPIAPVLLDTIWMSIHVPIIMVAYAVLALAALIAHGQLVLMAVAPGRRPLRDTLDRLHYWYVHVGAILLGAGILTGSLWGSTSWGRYWGWDAKEVWSLIAFLAYLTILHVRIDREAWPAWAWAVAATLAAGVFSVVARSLGAQDRAVWIGLSLAAAALVLFVAARGPLATAIKSVVAFWMIIMTYVGVNFVLGTGMHSYGFGTGAVVHYLYRVGGADLALIALAGVVYVARTRFAAPRSPTAQPSP